MDGQDFKLSEVKKQIKSIEGKQENVQQQDIVDAFEAFLEGEEFLDKFLKLPLNGSPEEVMLMRYFFKVANICIFDQLDQYSDFKKVYEVSEITLKLVSIAKYADLVLEKRFMNNFFIKRFDEIITINILKIFDVIIQHDDLEFIEDIYNNSYHFQLIYIFPLFSDQEIQNNILIILNNYFIKLKEKKIVRTECYEFQKIIELSNIVIESNNPDILHSYMKLISNIFCVFDEIKFDQQEINLMFQLFSECREKDFEAEIFDCMSYFLTHLENIIFIPKITDFLNVHSIEDILSRGEEFQLSTINIIFKYTYNVFWRQAEEIEFDYVKELLVFLSGVFHMLKIKSKLKAVELTDELLSYKRFDIIVLLYESGLFANIVDTMDIESTKALHHIINILDTLFFVCRRDEQFDFLHVFLENIDIETPINQIKDESDDKLICVKLENLLREFYSFVGIEAE